MLRRDLLKMMAASAVVWHSPVFALNSQQQAKCVWVVLRGAMDGLSAVVPEFETTLSQLRPGLVPENTFALERGFGLHPQLKFMHQLYQQRQLLPIVATASSYRQRSHFDGQDWLESGLPEIDHDSGWLARVSSLAQKDSLAIAQSLPISLRHDVRYPTWYPSRFKNVSEDLYSTLQGLYAEQDMLSTRLDEVITTRQELGDSNGGTSFKQLASNCGQFLTQVNGPDCAMLELGGWDTHNNQNSRLNQQFATLDQGIEALQQSLGQQWQNTVVIIATEFGRTVKQNGTSGTDHGTAGTMFLAGGAVNGGQIMGQWPGLEQHNLYQQRDLMPTSNNFDWFASVLAQHWNLSTEQMLQAFPGFIPRAEQLVS